MPLKYGVLPRHLLQQARSFLTAAPSLRVVPILADGSLKTFQQEAFIPATPALLPRGTFTTIPAIQKWFPKSPKQNGSPTLNTEYLAQWAPTVVPLEITSDGQFTQIHQPFQFFLDASTTDQKANIYLAQASLSDLPPSMLKDLPTPDLVSRAGKGDVYSTSIWLGHAPTYTPLHRDPNPNLFVQLCGNKKVRLFNPSLGNAMFHHVQSRIGGDANAVMRGAEMMEGMERKVLEDAVWGDGLRGAFWEKEGFECEVGPGDGLFIPKGWWHSIKGVGEGMVGSVNWWFR